MSVTGKRMRKNPHGWMLAAVLLLAAAGLLAVHSHQTAAVPPEEPAQEEPSVTVIPAEPELPELPEEPVEEDPVPEKPWGPVAESAPVDDSYFDDVAFVGDSRTDGFRLYSGLNRGTYFCVTGETVASATELENWKGENGKKVSLAEAVAAADCGRIYLMLGVNELGWKGTDIFRGHAENLIRRLKADHPDAELVIQSLLPVSAEQDTKGAYVNNQRILAYNQVWRELAEENGCAYVDVAKALTGEDGCLPEELSFDGVHLNRAGCRLWLNYLRTHSVAGKVPRESASAQTESEEAGPAPAPTESERP